MKYTKAEEIATLINVNVTTIMYRAKILNIKKRSTKEYLFTDLQVNKICNFNNRVKKKRKNKKNKTGKLQLLKDTFWNPVKEKTFFPDVRIEDGFYIVESKINNQ